MSEIDYEIAPYRAEHESDLAELEAVLWAGSIKENREQMRWKYEKSPYARESMRFVALARGKLVGARELVANGWEVRSADADPQSSPHRFIAVSAADLAVLPAHRNRGLFARLNEVALAAATDVGVPYALNFSASPVNYLNSLIAGWRETLSLDVVGRSRGDGAGFLATFKWSSLATRKFTRRSALRADTSAGRITSGDEPRPAEMAALVATAPLERRYATAANRRMVPLAIHVA